MLTDGAGIPLAVAVEGANRHDSRLLVATLEGLVVARPAREAEKDSPEPNLCLDAAYDSDEVRQELEARSYEPHISAAEERKIPRQQSITPANSRRMAPRILGFFPRRIACSSS